MVPARMGSHPEPGHPDMEQWIGSKLRKEYIKAVYFHSTYLIYMHGASWKMMDDSNWNQDCQEKYQQPQMCR